MGVFHRRLLLTVPPSLLSCTARETEERNLGLGSCLSRTAFHYEGGASLLGRFLAGRCRDATADLPVTGCPLVSSVSYCRHVHRADLCAPTQTIANCPDRLASLLSRPYHKVTVYDGSRLLGSHASDAVLSMTAAEMPSNAPRPTTKRLRSPATSWQTMDLSISITHLGSFRLTPLSPPQ